jgi:hypothetical protein
MWNVDSMRDSNKNVVSKIRELLQDWGIFCSSTNKDSLLMWSHYADHHRGVVLELQPKIQKDSVLLASRPVKYSDERPLIYKTLRDLLEKSFFMSLENSSTKTMEDLVFTKRSEWSYEDEYRLAIPGLINSGSSVAYMPFYSEELVRIYFGCRMTDAQKAALKGLARNLNPAVKFSRAVLAKRHYGLEWVDE